MLIGHSGLKIFYLKKNYFSIKGCAQKLTYTKQKTIYSISLVSSLLSKCFYFLFYSRLIKRCIVYTCSESCNSSAAIYLFYYATMIISEIIFLVLCNLAGHTGLVK